MLRDEENTLPIFRKHFIDINKDYNGGKIFALNLVQPTKGLEKKLLNMYEQLVHSSGFKSKVLVYHHFDYHTQCHKGSEPLS